MLMRGALLLARAIGGRRHELMYRTMEVSGSTMASWYFTSFFFCVGLVLTDLATAVVLEIFWSVHESALDQDKALAEAAQATQAMMSAKSGDSGFSAGLGVAQLPVRLDGGGGDGGGGGGSGGGDRRRDDNEAKPQHYSPPPSPTPAADSRVPAPLRVADSVPTDTRDHAQGLHTDVYPGEAAVPGRAGSAELDVAPEPTPAPPDAAPIRELRQRASRITEPASKSARSPHVAAGPPSLTTDAYSRMSKSDGVVRAVNVRVGVDMARAYEDVRLDAQLRGVEPGSKEEKGEEAVHGKVTSLLRGWNDAIASSNDAGAADRRRMAGQLSPTSQLNEIVRMMRFQEPAFVSPQATNWEMSWAQKVGCMKALGSAGMAELLLFFAHVAGHQRGRSDSTSWYYPTSGE